MHGAVRKKVLTALIVAGLSSTAAFPVWSSDLHEAKDGSSSADQSIHTYLVEFEEDGVLEYRGGVGNLAATASSTTDDGVTFNASSLDVQAYVSYLEVAVAQRSAAISSQLGRDVNVTHKYFYTHSGIALELTREEAAEVAKVPGVKSVARSTDDHLATHRSPSYIGAPAVWNAATPGGAANRGFGTRIAILDTGANSAHPSFANDASCGFTPANPKLIAVSCATATGPGGACNGANPEADATSSGHGVHVAGTAGGNTLTASATPAPEIPAPYTEISGVAPCAGINSYKVCNNPDGTCNTAQSIAAVNMAIAQASTGIRALNFSISGGTTPWSNSDADRAFLNAVNAGIFVAAAAGNTRTEIPNPVGQVNHRGPWVMTVANSYHDLNPVNRLSIVAPEAVATLQDISLIQGSTTPESANFSSTPIKIYPNNIEGCTDSGGFPANYFNGSVALVRRGVCSFAEKITNAVASGATMVVISNNQAGPISMDTTGAPTTVPSYSISSQVRGDELIAYVNTHLDSAAVSFDNTARVPDMLNEGSLRGPTPGVLADLTKPDIAAPGTRIYAASIASEGSYEFMTGTSMASPHVAGAGALLRTVRPTWTVTEIKSALQMTAKRTGFKDDSITPWDIDDAGSGRVQIGEAMNAGLVMDETVANFLAANPSGGSINIKQLNLPSVRNMACNESCTFTRVVKSTLATPSTWNVGFESASGINASVEPASFTLAPGATQTLTITANTGSYVPPEGTPNAPGFGYITFTEAASLSPQEHITVALRGTRPDLIFKNGFDGSGSSNPDLVTFEFNSPVTESYNGTCISFHTGTVREDLESCEGDNLNIYSTGTGIGFYWGYSGATDNRGGVVQGSVYRVLTSGATVGSDASFSSGTAAATMANWRVAGGTDGYLGFRFLNPETNAINYGFLHINSLGAEASGFPATIVGLTFDKTGAAVTIP